MVFSHFCSLLLNMLGDPFEEWSDLSPAQPRQWPFSGATASGAAARASPRDPHRWVERPVRSAQWVHRMVGMVVRWWTVKWWKLWREDMQEHQGGGNMWCGFPHASEESDM